MTKVGNATVVLTHAHMHRHTQMITVNIKHQSQRFAHWTECAFSTIDAQKNAYILRRYISRGQEC